MDQNPAQLEERLAQLPEDVRNAVLSVEWEGKVQAIGAKHHLHIDQIGALGDLTLMAMLGLFNLTEYPTRIAQELNIPAADAEGITKEVGDEVFMPIRDSLKKLSAGAPAAPMAAPKPAASAMSPAGAVAPAPTPAASSPAPLAKPAIPAPAPKPDLSAAEAMLSGVTVSTPAPKVPAPAPAMPSAAAQPLAQAPAAGEAPKPAAYATDPYREPPV